MSITISAHPELKKGEVFLMNCSTEAWGGIYWSTKRKGDVAYDPKGHVIPGQFPVFVEFWELDTKGFTFTFVKGSATPW